MTQVGRPMLAGDGGFDDIASVLTMLHQRRHTGVLHMLGKIPGSVYYVTGEIQHAQQAEKTGQNAFEEMMRESVTRTVHYEFHRDQNSGGLTTINTRHDFLLMAVAKVMDEQQEQEVRFENEDPSAFGLNNDPNLVDSLDLFRGMPPAPTQEQTMASQLILDDPELVTADAKVDLASEPMLTPQTWAAAQQILTERIGPSAARVMKLVCRDLKYPLVEQVGQIPMRDTSRFLTALGACIERMVPQEAAHIQDRLSALEREVL